MDLDEVLTHYPQIRKKILETAEERQRMVAERAKAFAKKKEEDKKREEENKLKVFQLFIFKGSKPELNLRICQNNTLNQSVPLVLSI